MDAQRFDWLSSAFANRFSRRKAVQVGGMGVGAATLGASLQAATAQDATPAGTPDPLAESARTYFLFVQTFQSGTLTPNPTEADAYILTLTGGAAQTVYFSDRPERIVGTMPTTAFLDGLGFAPDNPPNAALVAQTDAGEEIVVVELLNPVYTEDVGSEGKVTLTYDVVILADYQDEGLAHLAERQGDASLPEAFGAASLFIDECSDRVVGCNGPAEWPSSTRVGDIGEQDFCWSWSGLQCTPCNPGQYYIDLCNGTVPRCQGQCYDVEWIAS